eukprot:1208365-Pyramimonas_sp.AAC.1
MHSSELGLLPDLEPRNYSYWSSHLENCSRYSTRAEGGYSAGGHRNRFEETSGASDCRIQSSELGLLPKLGLRNYCIVRVILRGAV